jgi:UPF0716 family protein affecting phage T7 exclusion
MRGTVTLPLRLAAIAGGLLLIKPGYISDLIGLGLIALVAVIQFKFGKGDSPKITEG